MDQFAFISLREGVGRKTPALEVSIQKMYGIKNCPRRLVFTVKPIPFTDFWEKMDPVKHNH